MKIEHFYYDEQEKWLAQMKAAMEKHDAKLSEEERTLEQKKSDMELQNIIQNAEREEKQTYRIVNTEKYCWFKNITKRVIQFAQLSGCNIKIETLSSMDAVIKMQTGCIWLLSDGEAAQHIRVELAHLPQFGVSAVDLGTAAGLIAGRASLSEGDLRYPELV